jgi:hypothetical protein
MKEATIATLIFGAFAVSLALFLVLAGRLSFWKLVKALPDEAFEHFERESAWIFADDSERPNGYSGPYRLHVPSKSRTVKFFADDERVRESQSRFIDQYGDRIPTEGFPYISFLALLYPVAAMLSLSSTPFSVVEILGHGFANLGYLLLAAGIFAGQFRAFALDGRFVTMMTAAVSWIIGVMLTNII